MKKIAVILLLMFIFPMPALAEEPLPEPPPAPNAPTGLVASNVTQTSIDLSWHDNPSEEEVYSYTIYMDGIYLTSSSTTTYTVDNLEPDTGYQFYVTATNASGEGPASDVITVTTRSPHEPPYNLRTTNVGTTSISFTWEGFAPSYKIFLDDGEGAAESVVKTSGTEYTINDLQPDHTYGIYVVALYDDGESEPSNTLAVTTGLIQAPYNLSVTNVGATSIVLTWDGNAPDYDIYFEEGENDSLVGSTTENSYTITGLQPEEQYSVYVVAVYDEGASEPSNTLFVTTGATPVPASVDGIVGASFPYIRMLTPFLITAFAIGATFLIMERLPSVVGRRRYW